VVFAGGDRVRSVRASGAGPNADGAGGPERATRDERAGGTGKAV